jgi:L-arabinose isomerase
MRRPRAGVLALYVPFYEKIVELRKEKEAFAAAVVEKLSGIVDVVWPGIVDSAEAAGHACEKFRQERVDAIVVVPSLAVFGALGWAALEPLDLPVVVWSLQPASSIPERYDIAELIRNSGNLGVEALANTLARAGRLFRTVFSTGNAPAPERLTQFLRAAAVASDLRASTFGRIGSVFPQMTDVAMNASDWSAATRSRVVDVNLAELTARYTSQGAAAVEARVIEMISAHQHERISQDELSRSARLSLALDEIVNQFGLDGGAFNCHGENCLQNPQIGVTACYAVSRQTTQGRPFSCTGDLPTAVALYIMKRLTGGAIYGELDFVDTEADLVVIANGGEGDFSLADGAVELIGNENFSGLHGRGASPKMSMAPGPATLLSFTPIDSPRGYRMVVGLGWLVNRTISGLQVFHQAYRFRGVAAERAFEQWCDAGAVHHLALGPGDWGAELCALARFMGFEFMQVGGKSAVEG